MRTLPTTRSTGTTGWHRASCRSGCATAETPKANAQSPGGAFGYDLFAAVYDQWQQTYGAEYASLVAPKVNERLDRLVGQPRRLIDLACGTGTHALIQSARGVEVIGLDLSRAMLAVAEQKADSASRAITWVHGDMRSFDVAKPVDAVTCLYASLNHLAHPDELASTFARVAAHLRPGGAFVFDLNTRAGFEALWREPGTDAGPNVKIDRKYEWQDEGPWVTMHLRIERRDRDALEHGQETLRSRWFEDREVWTALEQARLTVVDVTPFNPFPKVDCPDIKQLWTATQPEKA